MPTQLPKGRSIWKILNDPEGGAVLIETTVNTDGTKYERTRHKARPESKKMMRKRNGKLKGRNIEVEPIKGYPSDLYMHSYYQSDPTSINQMDGNTSAEDNYSSESLAQAMAMTIYFASTFHSTMDIIFTNTPKEPPDGIITSLSTIPITCICILPHLFIACGCILRQKYKNNKRSKRHTKNKSRQVIQ